MGNVIVGGMIVLAVGTALAHIRKAKKNGMKCMGCSSGGNCSHCSSGCKSERK